MSGRPRGKMRNARLAKKANPPVKKKKKKKKRKPRGPILTKLRFQKALKGTCGIVRHIAYRAGVTVSAVHNCLKREDWEDMRLLFEQERLRMRELAKETIYDVMTQRMDLRSATAAAKWYLEKTDNEFKNVDTLKVEGGEPIKIQQAVVNLDSMEIPLDIRKQLLEKIEKKEKARLKQEDGI